MKEKMEAIRFQAKAINHKAQKMVLRCKKSEKKEKEVSVKH